MTTLLLTGATGLVGSRLLPRLVEDGYECRALVRGEAALPPGATGVRGDLADPDTLRAAGDGGDAGGHPAARGPAPGGAAAPAPRRAAVAGGGPGVPLAALFRTRDEAAIWRANRDGTRNLITAVQEHAPAARSPMRSTGHLSHAHHHTP